MFVGLLWIEADHHQDEDEGKQQEGAHYQQLERCHMILISDIRTIGMINKISKNIRKVAIISNWKVII